MQFLEDAVQTVGRFVPGIDVLGISFSKASMS